MPRRVFLFAAALALTTLAAACDDSNTNGELTVLGTPTVPATVEAVSPTATPEVQKEDLAAVQEFISQNGGEVDPAEITLADLTGDGAQEVIVPVTAGGTLGNIAIFVYSADQLNELLRELPPQEARGGHIRAEVESGQLSISWPVYGPDDPNSSPSGGLRVRTYRWDGNALILDGEALTTP